MDNNLDILRFTDFVRLDFFLANIDARRERKQQKRSVKGRPKFKEKRLSYGLSEPN